MNSVLAIIEKKVSDAIVAAYGSEFRSFDPLVRPSQFADLQVNAALPLSKLLSCSPRDVGQTLVGLLIPELDDFCEAITVSGPGFLNVTLRDDWIIGRVAVLSRSDRLGAPAEPRKRIVIDYSAPNVAKEMHVGHLRTTVVGDSLVRILEFLGHEVVPQNHIGDWGTPFGMLIEHLIEEGQNSEAVQMLEAKPNDFYQAARRKYDSDPNFAARSRSRVVDLQSGDPEALTLWSEIVALSKRYFNSVYARLGVRLGEQDLAGESTYNDQLHQLCDELENAGIAVHSEGALCVFLEGFFGRDGQPLPLIIRKSDGGFGYATTDLAALRHRIQILQADSILYVVGAPQSLHLRMVWEVARLAGWLPEQVQTVHVKIGNVLGVDRKILRTRSGAPMRLTELLDEATDAARKTLDRDRPHLEENTRAVVAPLIGIGAVKYADLSVAHQTEYVFDLQRMVALSGNTSPYLQYAAARIRSILRAASSSQVAAAEAFMLTEPAERTLALNLLGFSDAVRVAGRDLEPHHLCTYLFELAQSFSSFYEQCPVLKSSPKIQPTRLLLCRLTFQTLELGLELLGIEVPEVM